MPEWFEPARTDTRRIPRVEARTLELDGLRGIANSHGAGLPLRIGPDIAPTAPSSLRIFGFPIFSSGLFFRPFGFPDWRNPHLHTLGPSPAAGSPAFFHIFSLGTPHTVGSLVLAAVRADALAAGFLFAALGTVSYAPYLVHQSALVLPQYLLRHRPPSAIDARAISASLAALLLSGCGLLDFVVVF
jgi:hypothetical protein